MDKEHRIFNNLKPVLGGLFFVPPEAISIETKQADVEKWDSLGHLNLFLTIEQKFKVKFSLEEITTLSTVHGIVKALSSKIKE